MKALQKSLKSSGVPSESEESLLMFLRNPLNSLFIKPLQWRFLVEKSFVDKKITLHDCEISLTYLAIVFLNHKSI